MTQWCRYRSSLIILQNDIYIGFVVQFCCTIQFYDLNKHKKDQQYIVLSCTHHTATYNPTKLFCHNLNLQTHKFLVQFCWSWTHTRTTIHTISQNQPNCMTTLYREVLILLYIPKNVRLLKFSINAAWMKVEGTVLRIC